YIDEIGGNLRRVSIRLALEKTNAVRNTLYQQYKEATDINIKDEIFVNYTRFNNLITKLQTDSFMNSTWNIILGDIEIDFDRYRDKISHIIPMNDGYNINIFTLQRTKRTIKDFYTFSINGYFDPIIT